MDHIPVLKQEIVAGLNIKKNGRYVDCTAGRGGHIQAILDNCEGQVNIIGLDKDPENVKYLQNKFDKNYVRIVNSDYKNIDKVLSFFGWEKADGFVYDLGFSSIHVDCPDRGFSFSNDGPLDMRYDQKQELCAETIVNNYTTEELTKIFKEFGEEPFAKQIAKNIVNNRDIQRITRTSQLSSIVNSSIPAKVRNNMKISPSTKVFQALRIVVNSELQSLSESLDKSIELCNTGGRICVISFHSLEDRLVKNTFRKFTNPCTCPPKLPECICGKKAVLKLVNKKPVIPGKEEISYNFRARSAKLRIAEKE